METRTKSQPEPELTAVEAAAIARDEAARVASLVCKPALSDPECAEIIGLPVSSWYQFRDELNIREFFFIGRRRFTLTRALIAALEARAAANAASTQP
jgi:hypothetical protein